MKNEICIIYTDSFGFRLKCGLTQRAADGGESARFMSVFLASSCFCSQAFLYARPLSAANASRWAADIL
jgi:hypothetical protein